MTKLMINRSINCRSSTKKSVTFKDLTDLDGRSFISASEKLFKINICTEGGMWILFPVTSTESTRWTKRNNYSKKNLFHWSYGYLNIFKTWEKMWICPLRSKKNEFGFCKKGLSFHLVSKLNFVYRCWYPAWAFTLQNEPQHLNTTNFRYNLMKLCFYSLKKKTYLSGCRHTRWT